MTAGNQLWRRAILSNDATIGKAYQNLDETALKIVMVVNKAGVLEGTVSDGDIRRGLLKGLGLDSSIANIIHRNAFVVPAEVDRELVMQLMVSNKIQQIPIVDDRHRIVGLHLWDEVAQPVSRSNLMVIMAGGKGTRLHPHTFNCPKPMLKVGGKPMLEHIIERAKIEGFSNFMISINYLGEMIEKYFGSGEQLGVRIDYLREELPLGTAGSLGLLSPAPNTPIVVTNGDVMTDIRYGDLIDFHCRLSAIATMAVRSYELKHPFGVVQIEGVEIVGFEEKPVMASHINAGVYVLDPLALNLLTVNRPCDMPALFELLQEKSFRTVAFPMHEPWLDVGTPADLHLANRQND